ncbi:DNA repair protein RecO [Corynebacterium caspium]|uniref:DNA repair protein RecO n=1 Tax=Corynebacterium caspium TaxID=234828 RepID=UPI00037F80E8|nr:DNA repair protein RecO [Corynebacterium caspium]WKD58899.1 DNA repair protein RecO [Corynebacterium caspium DSM 44850]
MRRETIRDRAVVLRTYDFSEADRVVVLFTRSHGILRCVAKGVRRSKSRFGSRIQYFVDLDVQLAVGRNLHTIIAADTVEYFGSRIIEDYERYTLACAVLESAEKLAGVDARGDTAAYDRLLRVLRELQNSPVPTLAADAYLLQAMRHAGWEPELFSCVQCNEHGPHYNFSPALGGAVCAKCRPSGLRTVPTAALRLMWLLAHDYMTAAQDLLTELGPEAASTAHIADRLTRSHVQFHVEGRISSFQVLEEI